MCDYTAEIRESQKTTVVLGGCPWCQVETIQITRQCDVCRARNTAAAAAICPPVLPDPDHWQAMQELSAIKQWLEGRTCGDKRCNHEDCKRTFRALAAIDLVTGLAAELAVQKRINEDLARAIGR